MLTETKRAERRLISRLMLDEAEGEHDRLCSYFELYDSLTLHRAQHAVIQVQEPSLRLPRDLLQIATNLMANPRITRDESRNQIRTVSQPNLLTDSEIDYAIDTTIHLMLMVDCTVVDSHSIGYEINGYKPTKWKSNEKLNDFVFQAFSLDSASDRLKSEDAQRNRNMLKGWKLRKRAHVTFQPTDDLREHLLYDSQGDVVRLFRHTAWLKAQLRKAAQAKKTLDCDIVECLGMCITFFRFVC